MEIIFKSNENQSNFNYSSNLFKNKKTLNGFNKLAETMLFERVDGSEFDCQNVSFDKEITADLILCYPLKVVVREEIKFSTLHELISEIRKTYHKIYAKEAETLKAIRKNKHLYNRGTSDGLFGIWGHDIYDLCISSIRIVEGDDKPLIDVSIDS